MNNYLQLIKKELQKFGNVQVERVPRTQNGHADALVWLATSEGIERFDSIPIGRVHRLAIEESGNKKEQEKLEKLAREGPKPEKTPATGSGGSGSISDAKPSGQTSSMPKASTNNYRNYAVVAGIATAFAAFGWYYGSKKKESDQVQE